MMRSLEILVSSIVLTFCLQHLHFGYCDGFSKHIFGPLRLSVQICRDYGWSDQEKYLQPQNRQRITTAKKSCQKVGPLECSTKSNVTHTTSRHPVADGKSWQKQRLGCESAVLPAYNAPLDLGQRSKNYWSREACVTGPIGLAKNRIFFPSFLYYISRLGCLQHCESTRRSKSDALNKAFPQYCISNHVTSYDILYHIIPRIVYHTISHIMLLHYAAIKHTIRVCAVPFTQSLTSVASNWSQLSTLRKTLQSASASIP